MRSRCWCAAPTRFKPLVRCTCTMCTAGNGATAPGPPATRCYRAGPRRPNWRIGRIWLQGAEIRNCWVWSQRLRMSEDVKGPQGQGETAEFLVILACETTPQQPNSIKWQTSPRAGNCPEHVLENAPRIPTIAPQCRVLASPNPYPLRC